MSTVSRNSQKEHEILSTHDACERAKNFDGNDPFPEIPPALLSANHIIEYANATGMIAPLYGGNRMKKASYEGGIGENAYEYDSRERLVPVPIGDELVVKANSIVFVECDIHFRLPDFVAVRFNLHIRHVHRGLLLGTGPLVDPGYWGKLCIPLHNLTDQDYPIPRDEGLIWIEFTKTSGGSVKGRNPSSSSAAYWGIRQFIERAADQYGKSARRPVPIRSSIPVAVQENRELAQAAERSARKSEETVEKLKRRGDVAIGIGATAVFIAVVGLGFAFYDSVQSAYQSVWPQARDADRRSATNMGNIEVLKLKIGDMEAEIRDLRNQLIDAESQDDDR